MFLCVEPLLSLILALVSAISQSLAISVQLLQLDNRIALESLRVLELAADDSNFKV
jgi:hypothetical protein